MRTVITTFIALWVGFNAFAQGSVDSVLMDVERNNTGLSAYRKSIDAAKVANKTGLLPQNPELEFNYLWGNPSAMGNRTDFSIRQSFDFPTAYAHRNQIANLKNEQAELEYRKQRNEVLFQARLVCADLVYQNSLFVELKKRQAHAKQLADAGKAKFDIGETGILDYNKARVHYLNASNNLERVVIERRALESELARLNGGLPIAFNDSVTPDYTLSADFDQWYATVELNNPVLQWLKQEIDIDEQQRKLALSQSLPKFNAGYMSEKVVGQQFQGITVGVSIPLWENKNSVRVAKTKAIATQSMATDAKLRFYNEIKSFYMKVVDLQRSVADYRDALADFRTAELLSKALEKGEISIGEYLFELSMYYESIDKLIEMQHDAAKAYCELQRYL